MSRERKRIIDFRSYVTNNWESQTSRNEENCGSPSLKVSCESCTFLRLSSRAMAWSRRGLKAISALRAYICSGGKVKAEHVKEKRPKG